MPSGRSQSTDGESTDQQSPQATATTTWIFDLPQQLESTVPLCAKTCVSSYISQDWSCSTNNFTCLCSNYSTQGYTLGELALLCITLDCSNASEDKKVDAYTACASEPDAVSPTHSTLSLPTDIPTGTRTTTAPRTSLPHTTFSQSIASTPSSSVSAAVSESSLSITSVPSTSIHSPTATPASAAPKAPKDSTSLTTAQAVGISVACMGGLMAALGLFYLFACLKRRKANKAKEDRHSYDFVDDAPPRIPSSDHRLADQRGPLSGYARPRPELATEKHRTQWPGPHNDPYPYRESQPYQFNEKGIDRNTGLRRPVSPESPHSDCSMRTTSQLLPDKPNSIPPRNLPKSPPAENFSTPETVFEEERGARIPGALIPGGGLPAHPAVLKRKAPQYTNHYTRSPEPLKHPSLSLEIPRKASGSDSLGSLSGFPLPPPRAAVPPDDVQRSSGHSKSRSSNNSLLNYYASPDCASPDDLYSSTPIEELGQIRRPPPAAVTVTKPTYPPKAIRMSTASDTSRRTSFESTDPDEPTPPEEEEKQLTPVAELESPISGIRYPKVPRSSAQSVPRSPNYKGSPRLGTEFGRAEMPQVVPVTPEQQRPLKHSPSPSLSGSTLAAKRRGDDAAHDLEKGLYIKGSSHSRSNSQTMAPFQKESRSAPTRQNQRHESPLKGYGRVASSRTEAEWPLSNKPEMNTAVDAPMKSPLWEPKLTPRKEGDDLYLSVSAATPKAVRFHVR
ncbi:hypothetical protein M409DRAFT_52316 [Zasmidium cellare ATCC 36951]|uniref:Extracellular membrane protein CFEM domain-containing protein n=1 Tax=Zasmidium cellare ATCC 36951 TaxID=1080233 RepID=A0A6A6CRV7_ZASCE|nr:uncharacterized protein M409DRAFT_52316 [Zasmidium cellare ATCC 36951]KAF2169821.1 hypothetical protein M409DRAFT_52316 [Zasmidium cellare ATCC 36951]